ncbi:hypothetical protein LZ496_06230 [Sphingomonas sp. NSE70-1]|uniref:Uncharacterized protein n=1 Tax=Sphingomonas caseinilyticus TaxID=2908205 RepID=A0ABT0RU70_9SPHN|nr:hypothetical protein [Sphingomonas caseinilyticus]MCL6698378.1 hypothetical protein [Sphingomonas caseinilyticus]
MDDNQACDSAAPVLLTYGRHAPDDPPPLGASSNLETIETETRNYRHDGWTPTARASFLETLAKSGVVTDACREVRRSSQAAYALRNRDPLFAAGWDAALSMARARLADDLFHRAVHGTVDQIWKDGEVVAERHRHDNRLSIAVLNRLDARSDRAQRSGEPTLQLAANWEAYLAALAEDRTADMRDMMAPPPLEIDDDYAILGHGSDSMLIRQLHQLRQGKALDEAADIDDGEEEERIWIEDHSWRTNFPPPDGFNGFEEGCYGEPDYSRQCTPEERELLDRRYPDAFTDAATDQRQADEVEREAFFAALAEELGSLPTPV